MFDLSLVTAALQTILMNAIGASPVLQGDNPTFQVSFTGQSPEQSPVSTDTDLNLFLFHIAEDPYQKNTFWGAAGQGGPDQPVAYQPAFFDLYYLLSARSARSQSGDVHEQQVMGVALKALHDQPIVRLPTTPVPFGNPPAEFTVTMERPTWDELCRLWQGIGAPMRMSAQYRVAAVFLSPDVPPADAPEVKHFHVEAGNAPPSPGAPLPQLTTVSRRVKYDCPEGPIFYDMVPGTVAPVPTGGPNAPPAQVAMLRGAYIAPTDTVYVVSIDAHGNETEFDVTNTWVAPLSPPYPSPQPWTAVQLQPPATLGPLPTGCPPPGSYLVRVGRPSLSASYRTNSVTLAIAPWVKPPAGGASPVVNPGAGGVFTCSVYNLPATGGEVRLGTVVLSQKTGGGALGPGQWSVAGTTLKLKAPATLAPGQYGVRVAAAGVEADPAVWVAVP